MSIVASRHFFLVALVVVAFIYFLPIWKDRQIPFPGHLLMSFFSPWKEETWEGYPVGVPRKDLLGFDTVRMIGPWRTFVADELRHGRLPLWNPHQFMGAPLLANSQSAVLSPPNWLFLILPFSIAWTMLVVAQPTIAFFSMRAFLSATGSSHVATLLVALLYAFSGWMTVWIEWNIHGFVYAFFPLLLFFIHQKRFLRSVIVGSLIIFAGHPQMAVIAIAASTMYSLIKQRLRWTIGWLIALFLITSPQWVPMARYYSQADRERISKEFVYRETLVEWSQLPRLLAPNIFGNPATENYSGKGNFVETTTYTGIALVVFALYGISKKRDVIFPLTLLGLIVLFAFPNPLSLLIGERHIPVLSTSVASRWLMLFPLAVSILAAGGIDRVLKGLTLRPQGQTFPKWPAVAMTILFFSFWLWSFQDNTVARIIARRNLILPTGVLAITVTPLFLLRSKLIVLPLTTYYVLLVMVSSVSELALFAHKTMTYTESRFIYPDVPVLKKLQELTKNGERFGSSEGSAIESNFATWYGLYDIAGYDALYPSRVGELVWASHRQGNKDWDYPRSTVVSPTNPDLWRDTLWRLAGVRWILHKDDDLARIARGHNRSLFPVDRFRLVWGEGKWQIYENLLAFPRAFFIDDPSWIGEGPDMIRKIYSDPLPEITPATITQYEPTRVGVTVDAPSDGYLVLTDTFYPGWKATVDGQPVEIKPIFHVFRGVKVDAGTHQLIFDYKSI